MTSYRYGRDFSLALQYTKSIRLGFNISRASTDPIAMLRYYKALVNLTLYDGSYEDGITKYEAAFLISDTIWSRVVQNNTSIRKIAELASELEPPTYNKAQYEASWLRLLELIKQATRDELDKPG